jgi:hypothetical protein
LDAVGTLRERVLEQSEEREQKVYGDDETERGDVVHGRGDF